MTKSATHTYVLADSAKFHQSGAVAYLTFQEVYQVITDSGISGEDKDYLISQGIQVLLAE